MFEDQTEEVILDRMMNKISNDLDKREGSIIYNALAPAAQEVAKMYSDMDYFFKMYFCKPRYARRTFRFKGSRRRS
nr:hypothetical protein [Clostridium botulinum]